MGTAAVLTILVCTVCLVIRSMARDKKKENQAAAVTAAAAGDAISNFLQIHKNGVELSIQKVYNISVNTDIQIYDFIHQDVKR